MYIHICIYIYIYIYIERDICIYVCMCVHRERERERERERAIMDCPRCLRDSTPNLPTDIVGFRGFDSSIILILRGGILMSIGDFLESLSQAMLVGTMLVGRLGVFRRPSRTLGRVANQVGLIRCSC